MRVFGRRLLLRIDDVLKEGYCDVLFIRQDARQMLREILAPAPQHFFVDVQPSAVFVFGFDDHMNMRVLLVGVEHEGIAVLRCELFASELPSGGQDLFWRRGGGH